MRARKTSGPEPRGNDGCDWCNEPGADRLMLLNGVGATYATTRRFCSAACDGMWRAKWGA